MRFTIALLFVLIVACPSFATTGTVTVAKRQSGAIQKTTIAFTSNNAGVAYKQLQELSGQLIRVATIPSATPAPSASYDITLKDSYGFDVLLGGAADLSATVTKTFAPCLMDQDNLTTQAVPIAILGQLVFRADSVGSTKTATLVLYFRR